MLCDGLKPGELKEVPEALFTGEKYGPIMIIREQGKGHKEPIYLSECCPPIRLNELLIEWSADFSLRFWKAEAGTPVSAAARSAVHRYDRWAKCRRIFIRMRTLETAFYPPCEKGLRIGVIRDSLKTPHIAGRFDEWSADYCRVDSAGKTICISRCLCRCCPPIRLHITERRNTQFPHNSTHRLPFRQDDSFHFHLS